jgi:glycosyltransferase involved in cell wall biosynthesis
VAGRYIAVIIPHLGLYGGNLRYIELGNVLTDRGFDFTIATPAATRPAYLPFRGRVATLEELRADPPEILMASEQRYFPEFLAFPAKRKVFYFIIQKAARDAEIAGAGRKGEIELLANSSGTCAWLERKFGAKAKPVRGGINLDLFRPLEDGERERRRPGSFQVIAGGRFSRRRKGSRLVVRAVDRLARRREGLEIRFFDSSTIDHTAGLPKDLSCRARVRLDLDVPRERLRLLYGSSDLFVSAEKGAGWSNQTIEAMACGIPVVCTKSGTQDFAIPEETAIVVSRTVWHLQRAIRRMLDDSSLRQRLAVAGRAKAAEFTWDRTADELIAALGLEG